MRLEIKKVPSKSHFRTWDYHFCKNGEVIAECTNLNTANYLMMLELRGGKRDANIYKNLNNHNRKKV